jgi:hypothetical protein
MDIFETSKLYPSSELSETYHHYEFNIRHGMQYGILNHMMIISMISDWEIENLKIKDTSITMNMHRMQIC